MSSVRPRSTKNNATTDASSNLYKKTGTQHTKNATSSSSSTKLRAPLAPIQNSSKQNVNQNKALPYNAPRTRSQSRGKINVLKKVHQNNRNNSQQPKNGSQSYASKVSNNNNERTTAHHHQSSNFQNSVPQYVQKPRNTISRHDSGVYIDSVPSSYENNNSSLSLSSMQVDDSSLTTHFHDLHDDSKDDIENNFPMYDETSLSQNNKLKLCSTPIINKKQKRSELKNSKFLDSQFYSKEDAYRADWDLSDDINEKHYTSFKNNGIKQYEAFHDEYQNNYIKNMLKIEQRHAPDATYLLKQENYRQQWMLRQTNEMNYTSQRRQQQRRTAPTYEMRVKVVDWLLELQDHFRVVSPETFHLSISYIDRYFSTREVDQEKMQEVAVTATFLASKFVDYQSPSLNELSEITAHSVSKEDILAREKDMLKNFRCNLCTPTVYHFLMEIICSKRLTGMEFRQIRRVALYFCDISRLAYELLEFPSRVLAVACLFLSFSSCDGHDFGRSIIISSIDSQSSNHHPMFYMNIEVEELAKCIRMLMDVYKKALPQKFEDNNNNNDNKGTSVYEKFTLRDLHANKRWAITRSTFQNYDNRREFENWRMTVEKDLKQLIKLL